MDILNRIILLLGDRDQKELMDYLNLHKGNFTNWKSGRSNSYRKYLIEIAEFFNVSIDYLVYGKENELSKNEYEMLELFRKIPEREQIKEIGRLENLCENRSMTENPKIIGLKIARRTDGEAVRTSVTEEDFEKMMQLPEETDF